MFNHHSSESTSVRRIEDDQRGYYNEHDSTLEKNRTNFYDESTPAYDTPMIRGSGHRSQSVSQCQQGTIP